MNDIPRYLPDEPFPPYAYVPGRNPHPESDPAGHSFGRPPQTPAPPDPDRPRESRAFLYGVDLFNHGYYWEAHEAWESLWHACQRRGEAADFLKGLIKLAAAGVKAREGRPHGVRRHLARARELFESVRRRCRDEALFALPFDGLQDLCRRSPEDWPMASHRTTDRAADPPLLRLRNESKVERLEVERLIHVD